MIDKAFAETASPSTTMVSVAHPQRCFTSIKMARLREHMHITSNAALERNAIPCLAAYVCVNENNQADFG
ncbi:hypothetical protein GALL_01170 [mine drainage metagenome]|uniref:Uncharacterized protein n=1 Tax=mine drainage metagenome TaxID=410659 RepID=A0A1J5U4L1_9ZZZZ